MKLILSRKGFDSSSGGVPSPIFPDESLLALPIPDEQSNVCYDDIAYHQGNMGDLVDHLTKGRLSGKCGAHIDPDIIRKSLPRKRGWQPVFGQSGQAQSHLRNNRVGPGDLFLFFGLFRRVTLQEGHYSWCKNSKPCHVIWGWMQVGEVLPWIDDLPKGYDWAQYHPHVNRQSDPNNTLYIASRFLDLNGQKLELPGSGVFPLYSQDRLLTSPDADRVSMWQLPSWFYPKGKRTPLTYHADRKRWKKRKAHTQLQAVARGQEFVLDCDQYPEALNWVKQLIEEGL